VGVVLEEESATGFSPAASAGPILQLPGAVPVFVSLQHVSAPVAAAAVAAAAVSERWVVVQESGETLLECHGLESLQDSPSPHLEVCLQEVCHPRLHSHLGVTAVSASCWVATLLMTHGLVVEPSSMEEGGEYSDLLRVEVALVTVEG